MFKTIALYFSGRQSLKWIEEAGLNKLEREFGFIQYLEGKGASRKLQVQLYSAWLKKVMLLVTGVDDVLRMLNVTRRKEGMFRALTEVYAARTTSIDAIILLLNNLWKMFETHGASYLPTRMTEEILVRRAMELMCEHSYGLGHIECLAASIIDWIGAGAGSGGSERIVMTMALPKLQYNLSGAIDFASHFRHESSRNRFYLEFIKANGLANSHQVNLLVEEIESPEHGGKELAREILKIVESTNLMISTYARHALELVVWEKPAEKTVVVEQPSGILPPELKVFIQAAVSTGVLEPEMVLDILHEMRLDLLEAGMLEGKTHDNAGSASKCFICLALHNCDAPEAEVARLIRKRELAEIQEFLVINEANEEPW